VEKKPKANVRKKKIKCHFLAIGKTRKSNRTGKKGKMEDFHIGTTLSICDPPLKSKVESGKKRHLLPNLNHTHFNIGRGRPTEEHKPKPSAAGSKPIPKNKRTGKKTCTELNQYLAREKKKYTTNPEKTIR